VVAVGYPDRSGIPMRQKSIAMSLASVRAFFAEKAPDVTVIESSTSSATVALAAEAYGVEPARIAKTLSLRIGERVVLIVTSGTSRMDKEGQGLVRRQAEDARPRRGRRHYRS
jgi:prolyl-tRNA editing enzyme YbaK/EbsC (Cys-tRNA(Pro) deacylase)